MAGQLFTIVGQQTLKKSPFLTNFAVYDCDGGHAPVTVTKQLFECASIALMMEQLHPLTKLFKIERKLALKRASKDTHDVGAIAEETYNSWIDVQQFITNLKRRKTLAEADILKLVQLWDIFWEQYKERAYLLIELVKQKPEMRKKRKNLDDCIVQEGAMIYAIFYINEFGVEADVLALKQWLPYAKERADAKQRRIALCTPSERTSQQILNVILYILIYGITPLFIFLSFWKSFINLYILSLIYAIFFGLYYANVFRLRGGFRLRIGDIWREENIEENIPLFQTEAISVNMVVGPFYVTIAAITMFVYQLYMVGWDWFAKSYLMGVIFMLAFSVWFPYSPFVEKLVIFYSQKIRVGHRVFHADHLKKMAVDKHDVCYYLFEFSASESYEIRIENKYQADTKEFIVRWCEANQLPLVIYNKKRDGH